MDGDEYQVNLSKIVNRSKFEKKRSSRIRESL